MPTAPSALRKCCRNKVHSISRASLVRPTSQPSYTRLRLTVHCQCILQTKAVLEQVGPAWLLVRRILPCVMCTVPAAPVHLVYPGVGMSCVALCSSPCGPYACEPAWFPVLRCLLSLLMLLRGVVVVVLVLLMVVFVGVVSVLSTADRHRALLYLHTHTHTHTHTHHTHA